MADDIYPAGVDWSSGTTPMGSASMIDNQIAQTNPLQNQTVNGGSNSLWDFIQNGLQNLNSGNNKVGTNQFAQMATSAFAPRGGAMPQMGAAPPIHTPQGGSSLLQMIFGNR